MKVAIICSNLFNIDKTNKTGTGIFSNVLVNSLTKTKDKKSSITVFASGKSLLPAKIESISYQPSSADFQIIKNGKHIMFELALISKAFARQDTFDIFHVNIGDGDLVLPFAAFVKKPILITLHNVYNEDYVRKYFSLFKNNKNVFFVPLSDSQKKMLPGLRYVKKIPTGIDTNEFSFNSKGGKNIMWAGRFIPEKGPDLVLKLAKKTKHKAKLFGVIKDGFENWFEQNLKNQIKTKADRSLVSLHSNYERLRLIQYFQTSKLFLLPTFFEEAFPLVFLESLACGTPIVVFARGSAPEIIIDGVTGFLVNPSDNDIRGDWIVKKTGFAGLCEAVEKIYSMPDKNYKLMRQACRDHVVQNFSVEKMSKQYWEAYDTITKQQS